MSPDTPVDPTSQKPPSPRKSKATVHHPPSDVTPSELPNPPLTLEPMSNTSLTRVPLNLHSMHPENNTPGLVHRPVDPSPVRVSHTISIAGTRPVMANTPPNTHIADLRKAPMMLNRPIAPNQTEDSTRILEYLD